MMITTRHAAVTPLERKRVPLTDLVAQRDVMEAVLASGVPSDTPDEPVYTKPSPFLPGKYEIADGHHRVAETIRQGGTHVDIDHDPIEDDEPYEGPYYDFSQHTSRTSLESTDN